MLSEFSQYQFSPYFGRGIEKRRFGSGLDQLPDEASFSNVW